jgi:PhzF family phenazine biosynthesis protein
MTTLHVVDAFTDRPFTGNPAAVWIGARPADEAWMRLVARELNLSETAFLHPVEGGFSLRWFTPTAEVDLCGHATLGAAFALWETGALSNGAEAKFLTRSGWLRCTREGNWIVMDFPTLPCAPTVTPSGLAAALGAEPRDCAGNGMDLLVEIDDEATLRALRPDFARIAALPVRGVIVTARSLHPDFDFVSRFFAPAVGVPEDPVTGSAHCALGPYWQAKLGRSDLTGFQASARGGVVRMSVRGERIILRGQAVLMSRVELRHDAP